MAEFRWYLPLGIEGYTVLRSARDVYDSLIVESFHGYFINRSVGDVAK